MSAGFICTCPNPNHPDRRPFTGTLTCGRYATDQEVGGLCGSCAIDWHRPCSDTGLRVQLPGPEPYGDCGRCGWHSSSHGDRS